MKKKKKKTYDKNCILCRYKYDEDSCLKAISHGDFECPSLSNIFYGKIIKVPIIKQIYNICDKILSYWQSKQFEKHYISPYETDDMKFIWGLKSYDDLSSQDACLGSMNGIEVVYLKDEDKYTIGIETMYMFQDSVSTMQYLQFLLDKFTEFMQKSGHSTENSLSLYDVFTEGINMNTHFNTLEDCYSAFRLLVNGFCSLE